MPKKLFEQLLKFDYVFYIIIVLLLFAVAARSQSVPQEKLTTVKIYLLDTFESESLLQTLDLLPVERQVDAKSPLRSAIEAQLAGATDDENSQNLRTPIYGINLVALKVKSKIAYAHFTRTEKQKLGKYDALRFRNAVRQTALQFPTIRRIEICLDGVADFWLENSKTHKPCA
jgi:hypothetical protein